MNRWLILDGRRLYLLDEPATVKGRRVVDLDKPRGYKPKPITPDQLAELDAAIHSEDP